MKFLVCLNYSIKAKWLLIGPSSSTDFLPTCGPVPFSMDMGHRVVASPRKWRQKQCSPKRR